MKLFDIFKNKKVETLESKINDLQEELTATSAMSKSLIGFADGKTYYFDTGSSDSYADHYTIYRGIDMLASLGAGLPVDIYKGDTLVPEKTISPFGFDLTSPNPFMSFNQLQYMALTYFFYRGEYMVEIIDDEAGFYLMPINPQNMSKTQNGTWQYDNGAERRIITPDNLIYAALFNPDGGIESRGLGPVDVVKADLMNESSAIDYNTSWFKNAGNLGGFFYDKDGKARTEDMDLITKQFAASKSGTGNTGKTLGLPRGIRYEDFQQTMVEMQYLESRKDIRDRILAILGIHKSLFGVTDQVNRSVSEEATRMLWLHNLQPRMLRIQDAWQRQLFRPNFPLYTYKYDFNSIPELRQTPETVDKQAKLLKFLGYTTNEINTSLKLGMEDMDEAALNVRTLPNNLVPFDEFMDDGSEEATAMNHEAANELLSEYFSDDQVKELKSNTKRNTRIFVRSMNRLRRKSESKMAGKLGKFFSSELGDMMKIILGDQKADSGLDANLILAKIMNKINENKVKLIKITEPVYTDTSLSADGIAIKMVDSAKDAIAADAIIGKLTNEIVHISNYTYKLLSKQIRDGINAGETLEQIANRVKSVYKFQSSRARMIARTETLKIIEGTTDIRYRDAGVKMKAWLATGGSDSREEHNRNAAQGPIPYDQRFQNGQMTPADGSASQIINCRCTMIPVI